MNVRSRSQRVEVLANWLSLLQSLFFSLVESVVFLGLLVTANASKVRLKAEAATLGAFLWSVWFVLFVSVLALARCSPSVDVEALSSRQPIHANFFRSAWHKAELFALTIVAVCLLTLL